ncbi:MAG: endonuclease/exonuclease/phosphatase family protein [Rhodospirillaceae bacterium]|nr:endonuclease/exonuclease/phosphatase family protein [Rhodospirillaceae bacterium]
MISRSLAAAQRVIRLPLRKRSYRIVPEDDALRILGKASRKSLGNRFTLISWNMYKARRRRWLEDLTQMAEQADFILLQEAVLHGDREHPFHVSSGFEWIMGQNFAYQSRPVTSGVKTGSRIAALSRRMVRSRDREPMIDLPKTILATEYDILNSDGNLLLINIHAVNIVSAKKFTRQVEQVEGMIENHRGPVILAGDFNTWNRRRQSIVFKAVERHGLQRVPVAAPQWRHLNQVLDHVFYRGVTLRSAAALLNVRSSDHIPLKVEFEHAGGGK